jgi:subtilisin family serine protease
MRSSTTTFLAAALIVAVVAPATADAPRADQAQEEETGWIVTLADGVSPNAFGSALAQYAGGKLGFVYEEVLGGFSFNGSAQAAERLRKTPFVSSVVADQTFQLQQVPTGVSRIDGDELHALNGGAYQGQGVRVAVIDSGIDLDHPDLVQNIDESAGINCVTPGAAPDDDNSHGTHVAGIIGASLNGAGVAGVAPQATLVPVKSFDASGSASTAQVLCGINHVAGLAANGEPMVVNMSFVESGTDSVCDDADTTDAVHEAICDLTDTGAIAVAAAGNNSGPAEQSMPAVFDEVISVSALTDLDGAPGGLGGCVLIFIFCDDEMAYFSNYGPSVDVIAPGDPILSTVPGGGYAEKSGTSMAAPHVAGVVAAMLTADPTLTLATVRALLKISGECPSGSFNTGGPTCEGEVWTGDPDGVGEPLINAMRAVEVTLSLGAGGNIAPIASFSSDCDEFTCDFTDTTWEPDGSISSWTWDFGDGQVSSEQNPTHTYLAEAVYDVTLTVVDNAGDSGSAVGQVSVPPPPGAGESAGGW